MKHKYYLSSLVAGVGLLLAAVPAWSHHSAAVAYDMDKDITVQGIVTEVKWENPHSWVFLDVKDATGKIVKWRFEGGTPNVLFRRGITAAVLKPGVTLTIKGHPHRTENAGQLTEVVTADGKTLKMQLGGV